MNTSTSKRLFFALWPGHRPRSAIFKVARALHKQCAGRVVNFENLHLTLAFLGAVDEQQQACMEQVAEHIHVPRFSITLSTLGYWPKPKVAWLAPDTTPENLKRLVDLLTSQLQRCGYEPETRPFQAHVTLLRKAKDFPRDEQTRDIHWSVDRFALVESCSRTHGVEYQVLAEWPLV